MSQPPKGPSLSRYLPSVWYTLTKTSCVRSSASSTRPVNR